MTKLPMLTIEYAISHRPGFLKRAMAKMVSTDYFCTKNNFTCLI